MSILKNNQWGYVFDCCLFPALLQGDRAVESILGQLQAVRALADRFDVVAIIRGGGGDVGLNCYDQFSLAREVALFPLPVMTGIGHSTNETVVEMVAGENLITPTDVAYFLLQKYHDFSGKLQELAGRMIDRASGMIEEAKSIRRVLAGKLIQASLQAMGNEKYRLDLLSRDLASSSKDTLHNQRIYLQEVESRFRLKPLQVLYASTGRLDQLSAMLSLQAGQLIQKQGLLVSHAERQIRILDPMNVLRRGFSITYSNGKILRDSKEVNEGDEITTRLFAGVVRSEIRSKS